MSPKTPRKILAISSGGGHWVQMRRLRPAFNGLNVVYVSVKADYAQDTPGCRFYAVRDVNRWDRFGFVILSLQLIKILWRERPDVVITTGAAPGLLAICLARLMLGSKTMWIDSLANCGRVSGSGSVARRLVHVCLTQWPHLKQDDGPDYWGAVL